MLRMLCLGATLVLLLAACKTYTTEELPDDRLYFGNGGGFTGAYTEYLLLENGQLFKRESAQAEFMALPKIKRSQAKAIFKEWTAQQMSDQEFQHPGNVYRFLRMEQGSQTHRFTWGASDHPTPAVIKSFYKRCKALLPAEKSPDK